MRLQKDMDLIVHQVGAAEATSTAIPGMEGARRATGVPGIAVNMSSPLMINLLKYCLSIYIFCQLSKNKGELRLYISNPIQLLACSCMFNLIAHRCISQDRQSSLRIKHSLN